ncbi:MAG: hypothetical protein RE468_08900 [Acidithiobacillus caldus]|uniref:hypothetical protein n=1 Tax=Acidithiobacillus caldus TaxID=33059 RepID=UPI001301069F|nr:hypothetical protein [Acidithiobacillus caldus]MBU2802178.1 hypothetical protein [Acidithiobacillus caldus]WMT46026.1 MAG: hypothetical protein RE468_08900 [Acidithiobacillus caldus]
MASADIAAEVMWALDAFGALITIGASWFSYSLWKYDREQEKKRRRKRKRRDAT